MIAVSDVGAQSWHIRVHLFFHLHFHDSFDIKAFGGLSVGYETSTIAQDGRKTAFRYSLDVAGTGGNGTLGFERGPGEQAGEGLQRVYDPLWTNALTLLDFLALEDLLNRDINSANLGQFVLLRSRKHKPQ